MATILFLDEDSPLRTLTRAALRAAGHQIVEAETAENLISLASRQPFDLILVDLNPPDMDGLMMLGQLALVTGHGGVPIVTMCDGTLDVDLLATARAGAIDHLRKPFGFGDLDATLRRILDATPERRDDLRVIRKSSADLYASSISLIEEVRSAG